MHYSKVFACATLTVVSALVLVQANQYGNSGASPHGSQYGTALSHYPNAAGCQGYNCNKQASQGPYGPYHSYAVRPVVYGGPGMYHYKGYARHPPAANQHKQRYPRSYGMAPAYRRPAASGCHGRYCGSAPARHHSSPASHQYHRPQATHYMRPVKAVALVSANRYQARPAYQQQQQQHGGYYKPAASYGSGRAAAHGSSHYGPANSNAHHQSRYQQHGGRKNNYNGY